MTKKRVGVRVVGGEDVDYMKQRYLVITAENNFFSSRSFCETAIFLNRILH